MTTISTRSSLPGRFYLALVGGAYYILGLGCLLSLAVVAIRGLLEFGRVVLVGRHAWYGLLFSAWLTAGYVQVYREKRFPRIAKCLLPASAASFLMLSGWIALDEARRQSPYAVVIPVIVALPGVVGLGLVAKFGADPPSAGCSAGESGNDCRG